MKEIRIIYCALFAIILSGCFDLFREKKQTIVGNISVINPNNQEDKGYRLVEYKTDFNFNLLEDYVVNLVGNDTILAVQGLDKKNCNETFYLIHHHYGGDPISVTAIDQKSFEQFVAHTHFKYHFHSSTPNCP